jgi:hypothetical protein
LLGDVDTLYISKHDDYGNMFRDAWNTLDCLLPEVSEVLNSDNKESTITDASE